MPDASKHIGLNMLCCRGLIIKENKKLKCKMSPTKKNISRYTIPFIVVLVNILLLLWISLKISSKTYNDPEKGDKVSEDTISRIDKKNVNNNSTDTTKQMGTGDTTKHTVKEPLTIVINDLASPTAQIIMSIYDHSNKFPDKRDKLKEYKFIPNGNRLLVQLTDLDYGEYAIATFQDLHHKGDISTNLIGVPTDPFAFSNNYRPLIKAPSFNDCKFVYNESNNQVNMSMIRMAK